MILVLVLGLVPFCDSRPTEFEARSTLLLDLDIMSVLCVFCLFHDLSSVCLDVLGMDDEKL